MLIKSHDSTGVSLVNGGGASRIMGLAGGRKYLDERHVKIIDETGVSAGAIMTMFSMADVHDVDQITDFMLEFFPKPVPDFFTTLWRHPFNVLNWVLGDGLADMLPRLGMPPFSFPSGERMDLLPIIRKAWKKLGLKKPRKGFRFITTDKYGRPIAFPNTHGEDYDGPLAVAASCTIPYVFKPPECLVKGRLTKLYDGGVFHPHPVNWSPTMAIVLQLFCYPQYEKRPSDIEVFVGKAGFPPLARLTKEVIDDHVKCGYRQAQIALQAPINKGLIPSRL
jgi:predicted acylesterase/phospholipase RssA